MERKYFGTDGVRGVYGTGIVNETFFASLALAAGRFFRGRAGEGSGGTGRWTTVVGRDTRESGKPLAGAVAEALAGAGWRVLDLGVAPTPAIAWAAVREGAAFGVVITASHNPAADNGIKFFDGRGEKLSDSDEAAIERELDGGAPGVAFADGAVVECDVVERYVSHMTGLLPEGALTGWKIAVDTANGATGRTTPEVLIRLGASVEWIGRGNEGEIINDGVGSEFPEKIAAATASAGARLGVAHDGDGDRAIFCDEAGKPLSGDEVLGILGYYSLKFGELAGNTLVVSRQSNLGLDRLIESAGGRTLRTEIGDRYVLEAMKAGGFNLGGEASGHLLVRDWSPAGDGLAGALRLLSILLRTGRPLSELRGCFRPAPQRTANLAVREKVPFEELSGLRTEMEKVERKLGAKGRVLVRYSGTESKLRFLVEGEDVALVAASISDLLQAARRDLEAVNDGD